MGLSLAEIGETVTAGEYAMWELYFSQYPPGFLAAERVAEIGAGLASTKTKRVRVGEICGWVERRERELRRADGRVRLASEADREVRRERLVSGFERLMARTRAELQEV